MSERSRKIDRELAARRAALQQLLAELSDMLDEIEDADTDYSCSLAIPVEGVPTRLARLTSEVRNMFDLEEDELHLDALSQWRPDLRERFEQLNAEHADLLEQLDELYELAGSSVRPGSTWNDIEHHYRGFERRLASHRRDEEHLLAQAGWES